MVCVVEVLYPYDLTCQFIQISEFLRSCGVYVYETSMESEGWIGKSEATGIEQKIYLFRDLRHFKEVKEENAKSAVRYTEKSVYVICGQSTASDGSFSKTESLEDSLLPCIQRIDDENRCRGFLRPFFSYFEEKQLYRALFTVQNIRSASGLLQDSKKKLEAAISWLRNHPVSCGAYKYCYAYLGLFLNKAKRLLGENDVFSFEALKLLCAEVRRIEKEYPGLNELEGDLYFHFQNNYIFGIMHYESCLNSYNYTAPYKLSKYWMTIVESKKLEMKYLLKSFENNPENYKAAYDLARYRESPSDTEKTIQPYQGIVRRLSRKEECNSLTPIEFNTLCKSYKRIGCNIYKNKSNPRYYEAIQQYKKIFRLWNNCSDNKFIDCFPADYKSEIVAHYRKSYDIKGVLVSLSRIYDLISEKEKSEKAMEMAYGKEIENLGRISTDWM